VLGISENRPWKKKKWLLSTNITSLQLLTKNIPLAFIILTLLCVSHAKHRASNTYRMSPEAKLTYIYIKEKGKLKTGRKIHISNTLLQSKNNNVQLMQPLLYHI